jgi:hypothetical protein
VGWRALRAKRTRQIAQPTHGHRGIGIEGSQEVKTLALSPCSGVYKRIFLGRLPIHS